MQTIDAKRESCKAWYKKNKKRVSLYNKEYSHSKKTLITRIYVSQKSASKHRGHIPPTYTKQQLYDFAINSNEFNLLYDNWANSNYKKSNIPTFDRKYDNMGYSFSNFNKWLTWLDNKLKGEHDRKKGLSITSQMKHVIRIDKNGNIKEYVSIMIASRENKIIFQNISKCCKGERKTAGGYKWKFK